MSLSNALGGVCYDSLYQPSLPGSGGGASYAGNGGNGGGLVRITASDEVEIDGVISANGENATNSPSGAGSGGGICISAPSVSGAPPVNMPPVITPTQAPLGTAIVVSPKFHAAVAVALIGPCVVA